MAAGNEMPAAVSCPESAARDTGVAGQDARRCVSTRGTREEQTMTTDVTTSATKEVRAEGQPVQIERSAVGVVRGKDVEIGMAGVGLVIADGDVALTQGGGRAFVAGGDLRIHQGGGGTLIAAGDASINQGGAGSLLTLGAVSVEQGGIGVTLAREVRAGGGGIIGIALSPRVAVEPGGKVMLGLPQAAIAGAALGIVTGVIVALAQAARSR
jgi:hypothetical protein